MLPTFLSHWLESDLGTCATFGFSVYLLFMVWKKLASRWANWHPGVVKPLKWALYLATAGVVVLGLQALAANLMEVPNLLAAAGGAAIAPLLNMAGNWLRPKEKTRRGARIGSVADVNKMTKQSLPGCNFEDSFSLGGVRIPRSTEAYHFFVVGSTGSGKSVAITHLLDHLEKRGDMALVVDSGGEFASRYYRPERGDQIINPFDDRCAPWSPTVEMAGPWDAESLAKSMVPDGTGESKEWNSYAQTLVTSVLRRLVALNRLSIKDLLYYVQSADMEELKPFLAGTPAAAQLVSDKTFGSIRTIAANYLQTYAYLEDNENPFSVAKFIQAEKPGFLFLTYRDDQLDSLRNLMSCVLDIAARTILALPASQTRRVWLIIDEFASIGKVQSIEAIATKSRKMGGCLLVGLQSVSQLKDRYGEHAAQTILSCLSSWLVLRCSDADTAEYISKYIGDAEISRMTRGESSSESGGSDSLNEQIQTQRAIMPVELQRLPNCEGFFKLAGNYPVCDVKLKFPAKRQSAAERYAQRDFRARPMLDLTARPALPAPTQTGGETRVVADPAAAQRSEPAPLSRPETPLFKYRPRKNPMRAGPESLAEVITSMAAGHNG